VQIAKVLPSREHRNVDPASVDVNSKLALVTLAGLAGVLVILVSGEVKSIVQVAAAGVASILPAASVASTLKV